MALAGPELQEELKSAATISGLLVLGAVRQSDTFANHVTMTANLPIAWSGEEICISLVSADGLYEAQNTYRIDEDWTGGVAEIPYPTKFADRLLGFGKNDLAISTRAGSCEAEGDGSLMPIAWRSAGETGSKLVSVFANSFGSDEVILYVGSDPLADPIECAKIDTGVRTVFDTVCDIDISTHESENLLELEMVRISSGQMSPSEFIELKLGGDR